MIAAISARDNSAADDFDRLTAFFVGRLERLLVTLRSFVVALALFFLVVRLRFTAIVNPPPDSERIGYQNATLDRGTQTRRACRETGDPGGILPHGLACFQRASIPKSDAYLALHEIGKTLYSHLKRPTIV